MQRIKNGVLPVNPATPNDIISIFKNSEIMDAFGYTFGEGRTKNIFFDGVEQTSQFSFCVLSSKFMINLINTHISDDKIHILMDATFKTCPLGPFNQLLIVYVRKLHQVKFILDFRL